MDITALSSLLTKAIDQIDVTLSSAKANITSNKEKVVISEKAKDLSRAESEIQRGQKILRAAQTTIASIEKSLYQMKTLAFQASDRTISSVDAANKNYAYKELTRQIEKTVFAAEYDGVNLLMNSPSVKIRDVFLRSINIFPNPTIDYSKLTTPKAAFSAYQNIDNLLNVLNSNKLAMESSYKKLDFKLQEIQNNQSINQTRLSRVYSTGL